jgi:hypothetical protein
MGIIGRTRDEKFSTCQTKEIRRIQLVSITDTFFTSIGKIRFLPPV